MTLNRFLLSLTLCGMWEGTLTALLLVLLVVYMEPLLPVIRMVMRFVVSVAASKLDQFMRMLPTALSSATATIRGFITSTRGSHSSSCRRASSPRRTGSESRGSSIPADTLPRQGIARNLISSCWRAHRILLCTWRARSSSAVHWWHLSAAGG